MILSLVKIQLTLRGLILKGQAILSLSLSLIDYRMLRKPPERRQESTPKTVAARGHLNGRGPQAGGWTGRSLLRNGQTAACGRDERSEVSGVGSCEADGGFR